MKQPRLLAMIICLCLLAGMMTACGSSAGGTNAAPAASSQEAAEKPAAESAPAQVEYPTKSIEITCPYSPGGGSDTFGRAVADGFNRIFKETTVVTNRTGGSGQIGASFVMGKTDDPYSLITANSGDISTWYGMDIDVMSFKDVAIIAWDINVLLVAASSPYNTVEDLVAAAKEDPSKITLGGVSVGSDSHTLMLMLQEACGFEGTYVPFDGGGEVTSALLGGHITCSWSNPSEALGMMESGDVRALGIAAENRAKSLPDVPTFKEMGYDVVFSQFRGIQAPPETDEAYLEILRDAMKQVSESPEFQELAKNNYWEVDFLAGDDMRAVILEQNEIIAKYKH